MADTGRTVAEAILRKLGVIAQGETPEAAELNDTLSAVNDLISSWSNERLMVYAIIEETFTLTVAQQSYTLGPGGDFATIRPQWIDKILLRDNNPTQPVDYPVKLIPVEEWSRISVKGVSTQYPYFAYDDSGFPLRTIQIYPKPSQANNIIFYSAKALSSLTADTVLSFPPGYRRALIFNGAAEVAPEFGIEPSMLVLASAVDAKANIKRANHKTALLGTDAALINRRNDFNIHTGGY